MAPSRRDRPNDDTRHATLRLTLRIVKRIEGSPSIDTRRLASEFEVSERTIRRHLIALEGAGWAVPQWRKA